MLRLFAAAMATLVSGTLATAQTIDPMRHELSMRTFSGQGGIMLPAARVVYDTLCSLNAAGGDEADEGSGA